MGAISGTFPFGEPLSPVVQLDRGPKDVFVLGVYSSAVHARWIGPNGKTRVMALAVANEPRIFWAGEGAAEIIARISVPREAGSLVPAKPDFNGPSGRALDERILKPLGLDRSRVWCADLVTHSCLNPQQGKAVRERYTPLARKHGWPPVDMPSVPKALADDERRGELVAELRESGAKTMVLLGDQPVKWFLRAFDDRWKRLSDFGVTPETYGRLHEVGIAGVEYRVLPVAHPRQIAQLGRSSRRWHELHEAWISMQEAESRT